MEAINNINQLVIWLNITIKVPSLFIHIRLKTINSGLNYFALSHQAQGNLHWPWYYNLIRGTCCRKLGHLSPNLKSIFGYWNIKTKSPNLDRNLKKLTWSICRRIQYKISKKHQLKGQWHQFSRSVSWVLWSPIKFQIPH